MESIGSFAENLILNEIEEIKTGKTLPPTLRQAEVKAAPAGKDIRNIEVPTSFMEEVLGEEYSPPLKEEKSTVVEEVVEEPSTGAHPSLISEEKVDELISLLKDVKGMLSEMTTTGMLGVNLGGPGKASKSTEFTTGKYISPTKSSKAAKCILKKLSALKGEKRPEDDARDPGENEPGIADDPPMKVPKTRREVFKNVMKGYKKR
jgi:hypothetical protein